MFSQKGFYAATPNIKIRVVPELGYSLVFTPDDPNLYSLNANARLLLDLCDGRSGSALEDAYCAALYPMVERREAKRELRVSIEDLQRKGIVKNLGLSRTNREGG